jgi:DNA polymerase III alpha subunit
MTTHTDDVSKIRSFLFGNVEHLLDAVTKLRTSKIDSDSLFGDSGDSDTPQLQLSKDVPQFSELEVLLQEKNSLGLYVSGSPLSKYHELLEWVRDETSRDDVHLVLIDKIKKIFTRSGTMMLALQITSADDVTYEGIIFPKHAPKLSPLIAEKNLYWVKGRIMESRKKDTKADESEGSFEELPKIAFEEVAAFNEGIVALFRNEEVKMAINRQKTLSVVPWEVLQNHPEKLKQFIQGEEILKDGTAEGSVQIKIPSTVSGELLKRIKGLLLTTQATGTEPVELYLEKNGEYKKAKGSFFANVEKLNQLLDSAS